MSSSPSSSSSNVIITIIILVKCHHHHHHPRQMSSSPSSSSPKSKSRIPHHLNGSTQSSSSEPTMNRQVSTSAPNHHLMGKANIRWHLHHHNHGQSEKHSALDFVLIWQKNWQKTEFPKESSRNFLEDCDESDFVRVTSLDPNKAALYFPSAQNCSVFVYFRGAAPLRNQ